MSVIVGYILMFLRVIVVVSCVCLTVSLFISMIKRKRPAVIATLSMLDTPVDYDFNEDYVDSAQLFLSSFATLPCRLYEKMRRVAPLGWVTVNLCVSIGLWKMISPSDRL